MDENNANKTEKVTSRLKMSFTDEFGNNTIVETDIHGNTIHELMSAIGQCVKGFGYSEVLVHDYIPEC